MGSEGRGIRYGLDRTGQGQEQDKRTGNSSICARGVEWLEGTADGIPRARKRPDSHVGADGEKPWESLIWDASARVNPQPKLMGGLWSKVARWVCVARSQSSQSRVVDGGDGNSTLRAVFATHNY